MPEPPREEQMGVWCRKCGSTTYSTPKSDPCVEGYVRVHRCANPECGEEFGSIATWLSRTAAARTKYTPLVEKK